LGKEIKQLRIEIDDKEEFIKKLLSAKEKGCHQGEYCRFCKNHVMIVEPGHEWCVCTYGQCAHFEKEA